MKRILPYRCFSPTCIQTALHNNGLGDGTNIIQYMDVDVQKPHKTLDTKCPYCGITGCMRLTDVVHLVAPTPDAPVSAYRGSEYAQKTHLHFGFMCATAHEGFKQPRTPMYPKAFTDQVDAATCYECLQAYGLSLTRESINLFRS